MGFSGQGLKRCGCIQIRWDSFWQGRQGINEVTSLCFPGPRSCVCWNFHRKILSHWQEPLWGNRISLEPSKFLGMYANAWTSFRLQSRSKDLVIRFVGPHKVGICTPRKCPDGKRKNTFATIRSGQASFPQKILAVGQACLLCLSFLFRWIWRVKEKKPRKASLGRATMSLLLLSSHLQQEAVWVPPERQQQHL